MTVSPNLMMAILSMDAYNREYSAGVTLTGNKVGDADIIDRTSVGIGEPQYQAWQAAGFYAVAYEWQGQTVISYRGTNADSQGNFWTDVINGYLVGAGTSNNDQAHPAATDGALDPRAGAAMVMTH